MAAGTISKAFGLEGPFTAVDSACASSLQAMMFGARALRNKGYEVIEAKNGEGALEILETDAEKFDLLITDVVMPGVDGPTLIRQVRGDHPNMKVIFFSGFTEDTFRKNLDEGEVVHFLPEPFSLQQLAGKVKEVMQEDAA